MKKILISICVIFIIVIAVGIAYYKKIDYQSNSFKIATNQSSSDWSITATWLIYQWEGVKDGNDSYFDNVHNWESIITWITVPWGIAFRSDWKILVSERIGNILIYDPETKVQTVWAHIDVSQKSWSEKWLLWIAVDPKNDDIVYIAYTYQKWNSYINTLAKVDHTSEKEVVTKLIDGVIWNSNHDGGAVAIWNDGKIYWTMGDAQNDKTAQDMKSLNGKILRINTDGSIPDDNPSKDSYIYSYWHRNPQGLAWQPSTNLLWSSEHGPSRLWDCCRDELNIIVSWKDYGRPIIRGSQTKENLQAPIRISSESTTWAPWGMTFITEGSWKDNLLIAWLKWESIYRVIFDKDNPIKITSVERHLHSSFGRIRNVVEHDWYIYILTSNRDGRYIGLVKNEDDRVLRIKEK